MTEKPPAPEPEKPTLNNGELSPLFEDGRKPFTEVLKDNRMKMLTSDVAGSYNPEVIKYQHVDKMGDRGRDDLTDLADREITAMALYRAFNEQIAPIPATMAFLDHIHSLRRSRNRMGRQELVEILKRPPTYNKQEYAWELEERSANKPGLIDRMKGFFGGRNR